MPEIATLPRLFALRAGEGPGVLLLHGIGSSATSWKRQIERLRNAFALIAPDLRGYGDSSDPAGPAALDAVVADVTALLAPEPGPVDVVGVSFGALVALALARRRPALVRSLVLADATLGRGSVPPAERERWLAGRYALAADLASRSLERAAEIAAPGAPADVVAEIAAHMRRARPAGYRRVAEIIAATDATPWLPEIAVPTLVVCGAADAVVGLPLSRTIAERIPGARLTVIDGAGHAPHIERPDEFAAAVRTFLGAPA